MTIQPQNNNLNYLIDPTFTKVNRLFVLSFEIIEENNVKKDHGKLENQAHGATMSFYH